MGTLRESKDTPTLLLERGHKVLPGVGGQQSRVDQNQGARVGGRGLAVIVVEASNVTLLKLGHCGDLDIHGR